MGGGRLCCYYVTKHFAGSDWSAATYTAFPVFVKLATFFLSDQDGFHSM